MRKRSVDEFRMSLGEHLEDLRRRLIIGLLGVAVAAGFTLWLGTDLFMVLSRPLLKALKDHGLPPEVNFLTVTGPFMAYLKIALVGALVAAAPWLVYQLWKFVEAGLYSSERQIVYILAPLSVVMAITGVAFMYFAMLPICLNFFVSFATTQYPSGGEGQASINLVIEANQYINFVALLTLGIVVGFQLPVVMLILGRVGLVEASWLVRYRRHCVFVCLALGAALTPADVLSMMVLAAPLYVLFEFGLVLMRWGGKARRMPDDDQAEESPPAAV